MALCSTLSALGLRLTEQPLSERSLVITASEKTMVNHALTLRACVWK